MSPEAAMNPKLCELFKSRYVKKNLVLVAVDEAHCITEWFVVYCSHGRKFLRGNFFCLYEVEYYMELLSIGYVVVN